MTPTTAVSGCRCIGWVKGEDILVGAEEVHVGSGDVRLSGFHGHTEPFRFHVAPVVGGYSPQQAINAPTFHTTSMPGSFWPRTWEPGGAVVEDRLGGEVIAGLERRGHQFRRAGDWALGRLSAVVRDPLTGVLQAAANPRGAQGYAAGR
jgi:hypothetical protein